MSNVIIQNQTTANKAVKLKWTYPFYFLELELMKISASSD